MSSSLPVLPGRRDLVTAIGYGVVIWIVATGLIVTLGPVLVPDAGSWTRCYLRRNKGRSRSSSSSPAGCS